MKLKEKKLNKNKKMQLCFLNILLNKKLITQEEFAQITMIINN